MGWSLKKPLGGKSSVFQQVIRNPVPVITGAATGFLTSGFNPVGALTGAALATAAQDKARREGVAIEEAQNKILAEQAAAARAAGDLEALAQTEAEQRRLLGQQQQQQILGFAGEQEAKGAEFRKGLAERLAETSRGTFERMTPELLEDLNRRGLFTSQTARDTEFGRVLGDLAREEQTQLSGFDKQLYDQLSDIRGTGLSALLGGEQSALDAALELRKASIQRKFDESDAAREQAFSESLARRQSRDSLIGSLLGGAFQLGSGFLAGGGLNRSLAQPVATRPSSYSGSMFSSNPILNLYQGY